MSSVAESVTGPPSRTNSPLAQKSPPPTSPKAGSPALIADSSRVTRSPSLRPRRLDESTEMTYEPRLERDEERRRRLNDQRPYSPASASARDADNAEESSRSLRRRRRSSSVEPALGTTVGDERSRAARKWAPRDELDQVSGEYRRSSGGSVTALASMPSFAADAHLQRPFTSPTKHMPEFERQGSSDWQQSGRPLALEHETERHPVRRTSSSLRRTPPPHQQAQHHRTPPSITGWSPTSAEGSGSRRVKEEPGVPTSAPHARASGDEGRRGSWTGSAPPKSAQGPGPTIGPFPQAPPPSLASAPPLAGGAYPVPPPGPPVPPAAWSSHHPRPRQSVGSAANHLPQQNWLEQYRSQTQAQAAHRPAPYPRRTPPPPGPMPQGVRPIGPPTLLPVAGSAAAAYAPPMTSRPLVQTHRGDGPSRDASGSSTKSNLDGGGTPSSAGPSRTLHAPKSQAVFVTKLYTMLEDPHIRSSGLLRWSDDGMGFICADPTEFARTVLPQFFKHNNWHSFVRQLNMYGFNKQVNDVFQTIQASPEAPIAWEFRHGIFRRGDPSSINRIKRRSVKTAALPPAAYARPQDGIVTIRKYDPSAHPAEGSSSRSASASGAASTSARAYSTTAHYMSHPQPARGAVHAQESAMRFGGPRTHSPLPMANDRQLPPLQVVAPTGAFPPPPPFVHEPLRPLQQLSASRALPVPVPAGSDVRRQVEPAARYASPAPLPRDEPDSASSVNTSHFPVEAIVHHAARIEEAAEDLVNETAAIRSSEPYTRKETFDLIHSLRSHKRENMTGSDEDDVDLKVARIGMRFEDHDRRLSLSANAAEQIQAAAHALQSTLSAVVGGQGISGRTTPSISESYRRRSSAHSPTFAFAARRTSFDAAATSSRPASRGFRGALPDRRPASASAPRPIRVSPQPSRGRPSSSRSLGFIGPAASTGFTTTSRDRRDSLRDRPRTSPQEGRARSSSPKSHRSENSKAGGAIRDLLN